jgi:hypothetical protein
VCDLELHALPPRCPTLTRRRRRSRRS